MVPLTPTSTLLDAILVMGYFNVRRIPVVTWATASSVDGIENYITQSTILHEIQKMANDGLFSLDIALPASVGTSQVISVCETDSFLDSLIKMDSSVSRPPT